VYQTLGHIPMLVSWPGRQPGVIDALTTSVDLFATLCDVFGVEPEHRTHGRSIVPLVEGTASSIRDHVLTGVWGRGVHVIDGVHKYGRAPRHGNRPLSMWSNRWSTMPVHAWPGLRLPRPDHRAELAYMPGSSVPVIRQPFVGDDAVPFWARTNAADGDILFDVVGDPTEDANLVGGGLEARYVELLRHALTEVEAPADQFERLGL
jgi:hypothetical protein